MKRVSKGELEQFISDYPNELISETILICEPPVKLFKDSSRLVARICMNWLGPNEEIDTENHRRFWEYSIKV